MGVYAAPAVGSDATNRTVRVLVLDDDPVDAGLLADACSAVPEYDVRCRIAPDLLTGDLSEALEKAIALADTRDAGHLPGWKR